MATQHIHVFTVQGHGRFPLDMLRYDRCWPAAETESGRIAPNWSSPEDYKTERAIQMKGLNVPTKDRWNSFGWVVLASQTVRLS